MSAFVINPYTFGFSPASIAGLEIWLDGNDAGTLYNATSGGSLSASGGDVKRWEDKSGNGRHFTEATYPPSRVLSAVNGNAAIRFESPSAATGERLTRTGGTFAAGDFDNCFVVTQTSDTTYVFVTTTSNNNAFIDATASSTLPTLGSISVGARRINGLNVSNTRSAYLAARGSAPAILSTLGMSSQGAAFADLRLNYVPHGGGYEVSDGYVCELIVYSGTISDADRDKVENYLANKWGITL